MLQNIFLFKGKNFQDLDILNIYNYPDEIITINNTDLISKIIYGHDHGDIIQKYRNGKKIHRNRNNNHNNSNPCIIDESVPQVINNLNIFTSCINGKIIIGLIFEQDDNPYDYKDIFEELLNELLNVEMCCSFEDEIKIENLLITIFIDIRRYGDEYVEKIPIEFHYQHSFNKVFLFGNDAVGKTSLVRRITTGEYNDNYFTPTRLFNIEYVQKDDAVLVLWDMPGQRVFRDKWLKGLQDSNIIVFMIDIAKQLRFEESKREFWRILNRYELVGVPLLILGNKIDLVNHSNESSEQIIRLRKEIFDFFNFNNLENREWSFMFTSVKTNYNIEKVSDALFSLISI